MSKKILIVDDDHEIVEFIKAILKTKNYEAVGAYDGEEALQVMETLQPDLVITDLRMPKMSGLEFCRAVKTNPATENTPILVVTSLAAEVDKPEDFWRQGLGCDEFLAKPFDPLALLGRVEYLLRRSRYVSHQNGHTESPPPIPDTPRPESASSTAQPDVSSHASAPTAPSESRVKTPEEVVRDFIESWNSRNFAREYEAMDSEMHGGLSQNDYVQRRLQLYADEHGDLTQCHVIDIDGEIRNQMANVSCLREDTVKGVPKRKDERYTLRHTPHGWKIINVRSRPLTFTIES